LTLKKRTVKISYGTGAAWEKGLGGGGVTNMVSSTSNLSAFGGGKRGGIRRRRGERGWLNDRKINGLWRLS